MLAIYFFSCKGGAEKTAASDSANPTQDIINTGGTGLGVGSAEHISGSNLIAANDCLTCHKVDEENVGPSYKRIAEKYELNRGNVENLANKIIKGGKGLWGNAEMNPHPDLSYDDAEVMTGYILSLRDSAAH